MYTCLFLYFMYLLKFHLPLISSYSSLHYAHLTLRTRGSPTGKEFTKIDGFRILNTFKENSTIDGKALTKEHGESPQWWGSKKSVMKRSPKVYHRLKEMGFADEEIAPWVARDAPPGKTDAPPIETGASQVKTDVPQVETSETPSKHVPKGTGFTDPITASPQRDASLITPMHPGTTTGAPRRAYKGIPEHRLKQMSTPQLRKLSLTRTTDGGVYILGKEESGRITLDSLPEAPHAHVNIFLIISTFSSELIYY